MENTKDNEQRKLPTKFHAAVGMSRSWNARDAGREVARNTIKNLQSPPSFFLLFSTIHYQQHGGFQEFLDGIWDVLPPHTPLIGGTVNGFINNHGCFARGASALAMSYPNMDIAVGYGHRTKRNPKKAAKSCAAMIKNKLQNSPFQNKFLIDIISGPIIPKFPIVGRVNSVKSKFMGTLFTHLGMPLTEYFGYGIGKEGDIVDTLGNQLQDFHIIGGSTVDNGDQIACYQFINKKVYKNAIAAIGGTIDIPIFLKGSITGLRDTNMHFKITKTSFGNRIIKRIDNQPAKSRYTQIMNLPEELFKDLSPFYYKTSNYYPITFEGNREYISGVGAFLGNNILLGYKARGENAVILSVSGRESINSIDPIFSNYSDMHFPFMLMSASGIRFLNMIGDRAYKVKDKLDFYLANTPYLLTGYVNENIGYPGTLTASRVYSFNAMSFHNESPANLQ
jgi:hypothetical protein